MIRLKYSKAAMNAFYATGVFYTLCEHQKNSSFLMFSEGIERYQCHETG